MKRRCPRCNYYIDTSDLIKVENFEKIICKNCGRTLEVTNGSKSYVKTIYILFFFVVLILPLKILYIIGIEIIWFLFYKNILPAFFYNYKEKDDYKNGTG